MRFVCKRATVVAALISLVSAASAAATPLVIDTSTIAGGTFTAAFDLLDGNAVDDTAVLITLFDFGGGSATGSPVVTSGASGDLSSTIGLMNPGPSIIASLLQTFVAGSVLRFDWSVVSTNDGSIAPDTLVFSILDATGLPVATSDPSGANALLTVEASAAGVTAREFASRVPEPATILLFGMAGMAAIRRRGRR